MKRFFLILNVFLIFENGFSQLPALVDSAYTHLKEQFDRYHTCSYVYSDDNAGGNLFIPSVYEGDIENIKINQAFTENPYSGRSCTEIIFPLTPDSGFAAIKYVYPVYNIGNNQGFDLSEATELSFHAKGNGVVEFQIGGMNRRPFYSDTLPFQDGADIRSSGFINLSENWDDYQIDLTDNTFWVYKDSMEGLNNKYIKPVFMDYYENFDFYYGYDNGQGITCMKIYWFGGNTTWAGVFLFPPEGNWTGTQGYDLTGITKIHFKAKISESGNVKFLFGKEGDFSIAPIDTTITLTTDWQWYEWNLPSYLDYSDIVGGFGFFFGGNIGTPNYSTTYIDSVYYEGVELASDYSNLISGFSVFASKKPNSDTATIYIDEIKFDKDRTDKPRFCQSYVCLNDSIDVVQKNAAHTYDNALKLVTDLLLYDTTLNLQYLNEAKLLGDAFIYAINHDRFFNDGRIRNIYKSGELINYDSLVNMTGWWDDSLEVWSEDSIFMSTYTGNVAWTGLALSSLYEATYDTQYLDAAEILANWCIANTQTNYGFTGGFEGRDSTQQQITWKSTEHNIDLYVLFRRLECLTSNSIYQNAAENAEQFIHAMWNPIGNYFWPGTIDDGTTTNTDPNQIPLDIQSLYILAFKDTSSLYSSGIYWGNQNCYLHNFNSSNYSKPLSGFDFNKDKDGIWFEGSATSALANIFIGNQSFADSILSEIEYVQSNGIIYNNKGIVAADHNYVSTGFDWEYHNRISISATCWYIFAQLGLNPYYYHCDFPSGTNNKILLESNTLQLFQNYPNPFNEITEISFYIPMKQKINLEVYNIHGQKIKTLIEGEFESGIYQVTCNMKNNNRNIVLNGIYFYCLSSQEEKITRKMIVCK